MVKSLDHFFPLPGLNFLLPASAGGLHVWSPPLGYQQRHFQVNLNLLGTIVKNPFFHKLFRCKYRHLELLCHLCFQSHSDRIQDLSRKFFPRAKFVFASFPLGRRNARTLPKCLFEGFYYFLLVGDLTLCNSPPQGVGLLPGSPSPHTFLKVPSVPQAHLKFQADGIDCVSVSQCSFGEPWEIYSVSLYIFLIIYFIIYIFLKCIHTHTNIFKDLYKGVLYLRAHVSLFLSHRLQPISGS